jgi:subtilisin family serine protease
MASHGQSDITWSHGTISSSLIAARGDNGIGIVGVAWEAKIMPIVVLGADGFGSHYHIGRAIDYAIDQGADVINLSLFGFEDSEPMRRAIQRARKRGVVVVAAVGNDFALQEGLNVDVFPTSPACSEFLRDDVLGVAGTDVLDQHAIYTNTGERCSDIAAPADGIVAAHPRLPPPSPETEEDGEAREVIRGLTGTSLSAPLVSGAAALVKSLRPEWTAQDIYAHLLATSDAIEGSKQLDDPGYLGQGRLNIGKAVGSIASAADPSDFPQKKKPPVFKSGLLSQVIDFFTR